MVPSTASLVFVCCSCSYALSLPVKYFIDCVKYSIYGQPFPVRRWRCWRLYPGGRALRVTGATGWTCPPSPAAGPASQTCRRPRVSPSLAEGRMSDIGLSHWAVKEYLLLLSWQIVPLRGVREKLDDEFRGLQGNFKDQSLQGCQTVSLQAGDFIVNHFSSSCWSEQRQDGTADRPSQARERLQVEFSFHLSKLSLIWW